MLNIKLIKQFSHFFAIFAQNSTLFAIRMAQKVLYRAGAKFLQRCDYLLQGTHSHFYAVGAECRG